MRIDASMPALFDAIRDFLETVKLCGCCCAHVSGAVDTKALFGALYTQRPYYASFEYGFFDKKPAGVPSSAAATGAAVNKTVKLIPQIALLVRLHRLCLWFAAWTGFAHTG
jgi:hypothetical protein